MKYTDEYRDPRAAESLIRAIRGRATRRWAIMEVCGGQTHGLLRYGLDEALADVVEMIHGPGCPVCVTDAAVIDRAIQLSHEPNTLVTTFGDMLRVPGRQGSLATARASGGNIRSLYSPLDAVELAAREPQRQIVFFAVGFETTAPATALAVAQARHRGINNFSLLVAHVRVQPAMEMLLRRADCRVDGFLAAGHVCAVMGYESYTNLCRDYRVPVVVTGFEPLDLLSGILACVEELEQSRHQVVNRYERLVQRQGNVAAQDLVREVYEVCDCLWRGLDVVPQGGLRLREAWRQYDANARFVPQSLPILMRDECRAGDVLAGRIKPPECPAFGTRCTTLSPLGAPMVSSEGACAAYDRYHRPSVAADQGVS